MSKLLIIGNQNPEIGKEYHYSLSFIGFGSMPDNIFNPHPEITKWEIYVLENGKWRKTTGNSKQGNTVPYTFNQSSLTRKGIKICVTKGDDAGELIIKTKRAGQPKINRIELLDVNGNKVTKPLSYSDTLTVKAYCTDMEGETLQFTLWEDDAKGEGHNKINSINKINAFPVPGTVKKGVAKANFNMATYTMASFMANIHIAKGDKNEGKTHEYYATAEYFGKLEASNNVNLKNPSHHPNPAPTSGNKSGATKPPAKQQPNQRPVPLPPAPKKDTYKTPVTPKAKTKSPDPQGKIVSAEFVDMIGKPYKNMKFGTHVRAKIVSKNMTGKTVRLKIWEDDISNVLLFEKDYILGGDETFITLFLTAQMRKDGDDWKEGSEQEYFLEIEYAGQSVDSEVINVNDSAPTIKVAEPAVSMTGVGANKGGKNSEKGICECEAKVRAFMRMLRVGEATGELIKSYDKKQKKTVYIAHDFQKGYTTAFGGNLIKDLNTHPMKDYGGSSAAGAYQIMKYTYAWLGGSKLEWTGKYFKILDIYEVGHDYRKKYSIKDYQPESQDRLCICLMKDKKGMIELIIKDKIEDAIRKYGSAIWASLPYKGDNSRYEFKGKPQPATPLNKCLEHYNKFLKEELAGVSNLHLKKGFLKEFDYNCCKEGDGEVQPKPVSSGDWHDPVDNPICTIFTQSQTNGTINEAGKHWGLFGQNARNGTRPHKGLDLFAIPGSPIYACVKCEVTNVVTVAQAGYGKSITLKVIDKEAFLKHKRNYNLVFPNKEDKQDSGFTTDGDIYLFYGHLRKISVLKGDIIDDIAKSIGETGVSGVQSGGTCAPHVHFEIRDGSKKRCNPGYYIYYKSYDEQSQSESNLQIKTAKAGKINEFYGK